MQFGVGALPKQEVGQPLFAAGPDHEVDVSKPGFAGDELGKYLAAEIAYPCSLRHGIEDRIAGRIVDGDAQIQDIAWRGGAFRPPDCRWDAVGEPVAAA